jgi:hypothetical protein
VNRGHAARLAREQHAHDRRIARGERLFDARANAYQALLRELRQAMLTVERTHPMIGPKPPLPEPTSEAEWEDMYINVAVYGSADLMEAFEASASKVQEFQAHVFTHERVQEQQGPGDTWRPMLRAREEAGQALRLLERKMRDELAEL